MKARAARTGSLEEWPAGWGSRMRNHRLGSGSPRILLGMWRILVACGQAGGGRDLPSFVRPWGAIESFGCDQSSA